MNLSAIIANFQTFKLVDLLRYFLLQFLFSVIQPFPGCS